MSGGVDQQRRELRFCFLFYLLLFVYNLVGFAFFFGAVVFYLLGLGGLLLCWDFGLYFEKELNVGCLGRKR